MKMKNDWIMMKSRQLGVSTSVEQFNQEYNVACIDDIKEKMQEDITWEINQMYVKAKALGFPDKVNFQVKVWTPVKVNTPSWVVSPDVIFYRPHSTGGGEGFLDNLNDFEYNEYGMSKELCSLLVLMKVFYHKDWNGKDWIDMPLFQTVNNIQQTILDKLSKAMADEIDRQILMDCYTDLKSGSWFPEVKFKNENKIKVSDRLTYGVNIRFPIKPIIFGDTS